MQLAERSDLVVVGTIMEEREEPFLSVAFPRMYSLWRVRVEETLSGHATNGVVDITYRSGWFSGMRGKTVLLFGRRMPVKVGHRWGKDEEPPVLLSDVLEPTEYGAIFLLRPDREGDGGYWGPSVSGRYVPWLPEREARTEASWPAFVGEVRAAVEGTGSTGSLLPGAYHPSLALEEEGGWSVGLLEYGPYDTPRDLPPRPSVRMVSSASLRTSLAELQAMTLAYGVDSDPSDGSGPEREQVLRLYSAVAEYRTALTAAGSDHAWLLREFDLRLLGLLSGGRPSFEQVRAEACGALVVPMDCPRDGFPTCGTYDRLVEVAEALCEDPKASIGDDCDVPSRFGLDGRGVCVRDTSPWWLR